MKLAYIKNLLDAEVLYGAEWLNREVKSACGSDLMSDVLAFTQEHALLLTGLTNVQVIRTAEMSDLAAIMFVRGKRPGSEVIEMAKKMKIPLLLTERQMYEACGMLYKDGLAGCSPKEEILCCHDTE
ncbi:DRTGG domain-containing protein [Sporomusa acidovorans]|uniref:DRTGG domain-containing protein n=1 Tax=Sporomusa acidovorans (strain ATCC 49682 / DSM 3132 / Mol) TaxID=1123286 RepID=A0ABZ3J1G4_SPOA4|nr:DRTGG domain-containing protein [Sporomusa acidovorans]OZC22469.1 DRTGG domain protein [Sporomusa acidovorans DSM 3132]SDE74129.1 DRTGG domain-containing protein [Sporomusa acidovorans]